MVQSRTYNFGDLLTQGRAKSLASRLFPAGIYDGFVPSVVSVSEIALSAGALMTPGGVLVVESTGVTVAPPGLGGDASTHTLVASHSDIQAIGGSSVRYDWEDGLRERVGDPDENSLAVLWLRYPGTGPLTTAMMSSPPSQRGGSAALEGETGYLRAPFPYACDVVAGGANVVRTAASHSSGAQHLGWSLTNTAPSGVLTLAFKLPLPTTPRARFIDVFADIANLGIVAVTVKATDGTTIATTPASVSGPAVGLTEPVATFALASTGVAPATLAVVVTVPSASSGVFLKAFRVRAD